MDTNNTPETLDLNSRDSVIRIIRAELRRRSGKTWSVKGDRGTAWGWIRISAPPARLVDGWKLSEEDQAELAMLLNMGVGNSAVVIPPQDDYRTEYVDRARGLAPSVIGVPQWD